MESEGNGKVSEGSEVFSTEGEVIFGPGTDGMGGITAAREAIDRRLR